MSAYATHLLKGGYGSRVTECGQHRAAVAFDFRDFRAASKESQDGICVKCKTALDRRLAVVRARKVTA